MAFLHTLNEWPLQQLCTTVQPLDVECLGVENGAIHGLRFPFIAPISTKTLYLTVFAQLIAIADGSTDLSLAGPVGRQRVKDVYLCEWKTANFGPLRGEALRAISMTFGRCDYVGEINKTAKFDFDRTKNGAAIGT